MKRKVICVAGASAVGKSTVIDAVVARTNAAEQAFSLTNRHLRGPTDKRIHVSTDEFERRKNAGDFIEHIVYGEYLYGISKSVVNEILQRDKIAILDCNEAGVLQVMNADLDAQIITIFLVCSAENLYERQIRRDGFGLNSEVKTFRLRSSLQEIEGANKKHIFQFVVDNSDLAKATEKILRIISDDTSVESDPFDVSEFKRKMTKILSDLKQEN